MNSLLAEHPIVGVFGEIDRLLNLPDDEGSRKENQRKISSLLQKMEALFNQKGGILDELVSFLPPASLKGLLSDLQQLKDILTLYQCKSRLFRLVNCRGFTEMLMAMVHKLARSLAAVACGLPEDSELWKSSNDLASEMKNTELKVSAMEEHICRAIDEELSKGENDSSVNDNLITNLTLELRMANQHDPSQFSSEIDMYRRDAEDSLNRRDLEVAHLLEKLFRNQVNEPQEDSTLHSIANVAALAEFEELPLPAFKTFSCPLSREVMRNPVVLMETGQTYEQEEIEKWFKCCDQEGRVRTCPTTGQVIKSSPRRDLVLQNTIEEWRDRNTDTLIARAAQKLSSKDSMQEFEKAVVAVFRISEESVHYKHKLRNAGIIPLLLRPWDGPLDTGHLVRSKVLDALRSMASKNEENKLEMANENVVRLAVKSLTSDLEQEKESAVRLLCELSSQSEVCAKIGQQKGAILVLNGFISNGDNATLANLANQTMKHLQGNQSNVMALAEAGHLEPLLECLSEGPLDVKLQMVSHLSRTILSSNDKEMAIKQVGPSLIELLSYDVEDKNVVLKTLLMLSTPANNAPALINLGILPPLFSILSSNTSNVQLKENTAAIFENLLSKAGLWESYPIASDGITLQSELAIHCFLRLLNRMGLQRKSTLLRILYYIACSPQAADAAAQHIESGSGITVLNACLQESDSEVSMQALNLLGVLSLRKPSEIADELRRTSRFDFVKRLLKGFDPERQSAAAFIFANISLSEREVVEVLGIDLIPWIINDLHASESSRVIRGVACFTLMEGLIGLLLQFCKSSELRILQELRNHRVMVVLRKNMVLSSQPSIKKLAAEGLEMLSEKTPIQVDVEAAPSQSLCCFSFFAERKEEQATCNVHGIICEESTAFCLVTIKAVQPLVDLLEVENAGVQIAALGALSTLLGDSVNLKSGLEEVEKADGIKVIIDLFCLGHAPAELQDKLVWIIERVTRVENMCQKYSVNRVLIKTLVEMYRTSSNQTTRRLSQDALTNLKQISGMNAVRR